MRMIKGYIVRRNSIIINGYAILDLEHHFT